MPCGSTFKNRRGFTLVELSIVLLVAGLVASAIWVASGNVNSTRKVNDAVAETQTIARNVIGLMAGHVIPAAYQYGNWTAFNAALLSSGAIPSIYATPGSTGGVNHPWNNGVTGAYGKGLEVWGVGNYEFRIILFNLPVSACEQMILAMTTCSVGQQGCPYAVGSSVQTGTGPTTVGLSPPPTWKELATMTFAQTMCASATGQQGFIYFDYMLI